MLTRHYHHAEIEPDRWNRSLQHLLAACRALCALLYRDTTPQTTNRSEKIRNGTHNKTSSERTFGRRRVSSLQGAGKGQTGKVRLSSFLCQSRAKWSVARDLRRCVVAGEGCEVDGGWVDEAEINSLKLNDLQSLAGWRQSVVSCTRCKCK